MKKAYAKPMIEQRRFEMEECLTTSWAGPSGSWDVTSSGVDSAQGTVNWDDWFN